jgi:hypothetical protein
VQTEIVNTTGVELDGRDLAIGECFGALLKTRNRFALGELEGENPVEARVPGETLSFNPWFKPRV